MSGNGGRSWWNEVPDDQLVFPRILEGALEDEAFAINRILDRFTNMRHTGPPSELPDSAPLSTCRRACGKARRPQYEQCSARLMQRSASSGARAAQERDSKPQVEDGVEQQA